MTDIAAESESTPPNPKGKARAVSNGISHRESALMGERGSSVRTIRKIISGPPEWIWLISSYRFRFSPGELYELARQINLGPC